MLAYTWIKWPLLLCSSLESNSSDTIFIGQTRKRVFEMGMLSPAGWIRPHHVYRGLTAHFKFEWISWACFLGTPTHRNKKVCPDSLVRFMRNVSCNTVAYFLSMSLLRSQTHWTNLNLNKSHYLLSRRKSVTCSFKTCSQRT